MEHYQKNLKSLILENKKRVAVLVASLIFVVALGFTCAFNLTKTITIVVDPSQAGQEAETITVDNVNMNTKVSTILKDQNISTEDCTVSVDVNDTIRDVNEIVVKSKVKGTLSVDGQQISYDSSASTIGDLLNELNVELDADDEVSPSADTALTQDITTVSVNRVEYKEEQKTEDIAFETQETEDANLDTDTVEVDQQGVNGSKIITEKVKYVNGQPVSSEVLTEEVTAEPVAQVQRKGTKATASSSSSSSGSTSYTGTAVSVSEDDFEMICAIVAHEGGTSYDGAWAVMSAVMNRYYAGYASTVLGVLTAPGQFSSYLQGYYTQYLGASIPEVRQAVTDALNGNLMHSYRNFHAGSTGSGGEFLVNQYFYN